MANEVRVKGIGDVSDLTDSFGRVGSAAREMSNDVGASSREMGSGLDSAGEAADGAEGKAQGFSDTLTGTSDLMAGAGDIAKGNLFEGFVTAGQGAADLAGGLASFVIPAMKTLTKETLANASSFVKDKVAMVGSKIASLASAAATRAMTIAQKALNLAMRMNPIGLVITAIIALVAIVILIEKKTGFFSKTWKVVWAGIKDVIGNAIGFIRDHWGTIFKILTGPVGIAVRFIARNKDQIIGFFKAIPGAIKTAFKGLASFISLPFTTAFNAIKSLWNSTVGGFGFSVPGWVPGVGGNSFTIPNMHTGGIVPGLPGQDRLMRLTGGERIVPPGSSGGGGVIEIRSDGTKMADLLVDVLREAIRVRGGNVQLVLGKR